jgi:hypothetical protein
MARFMRAIHMVCPAVQVAKGLWMARTSRAMTTMEWIGARMITTKTGTCHCGAVEFEVTLEKGLENLRRCNCSLCRRKGAIMAGVPIANLKVVKGADMLTLYQWNTKLAKHYFCKMCGIYTHHQRRSNPNEYGVNVACLEGVDPFALGDIPVGDGASMSGGRAPQRRSQP